jgi:hypothetical protein
MIEITTGTIEERIIKFLQKTYPVTVNDLENNLHVSRKIIIRVLQKLQTKGILRLEPLPDKTFIRLLRNDFKFIGKKRQRKFIKHYTGKKKVISKEYDGDMYA